MVLCYNWKLTPTHVHLKSVKGVVLVSWISTDIVYNKRTAIVVGEQYEKEQYQEIDQQP